MKTCTLFLLLVAAVASAQIPNVRENKSVFIPDAVAKIPSSDYETSVSLTEDMIQQLKDLGIRKDLPVQVVSLDKTGEKGVSQTGTTIADLKAKNERSRIVFEKLSEAEKMAVIAVLGEADPIDDPEFRHPYYLKYWEDRRDDDEKKYDELTAVSQRPGITTDELIANRKKLADAEEHLKKVNAIISEVESMERAENAKKFSIFFPTIKRKGDSLRRKELFYKSIYDKSVSKDFYFANNAALQFNGAGGSLQSELVSAYLSAMRVSVSTSVSNGHSSGDNSTGNRTQENPADVVDITDTEAFQQLVSTGGNLNISGILPVFFYGTRHSTIYAHAFSKIAAQIAELSNDMDTSTANMSAGGNAYASTDTDGHELSFFVNSSLGWYMGGKTYYDNLSIADRRAFMFAQLTFGMTIKSSIRLTLTTNTFSSEENLRSGKVVFGAQILTN